MGMLGLRMCSLDPDIHVLYLRRSSPVVGRGMQPGRVFQHKLKVALLTCFRRVVLKTDVFRASLKGILRGDVAQRAHDCMDTNLRCIE